MTDHTDNPPDRNMATNDGLGLNDETLFEEGSTETTPSTWTRLWQVFREDKLALFGAVIVIGFVLIAVLAPVVAPYNPDTTYNWFQSPNSHSVGDFNADGQTERVWHPLGTDSFGHDVLSRIIYGARVSLMVALATVLFAFVIGTSIGLMAGYYGKWIDDLLMRYIDFQWAFPELILAIAIIAFVGGLGVWNVILAIGIAYIDDFARIIRSEALSLREEEFVLAARAFGMPNRRIMLREIFPNAIAPIIVQATLMIPLAILAEAGLSFLGVGVKPTTPTWGLMLSQGKRFLSRAWWLSVIPGLAIMVTVLGFNMLGDGIRDAFDVTEEEVEM